MNIEEFNVGVGCKGILNGVRCAYAVFRDLHRNRWVAFLVFSI